MTRWNSASLASSFHHQIFYWAIQFGKRPVAYFMLAFVVFWYTLTPRVRRRSEAYISHRFPDAGFIRRWYIAYRLNLNFGLTLVDRAALGILNDVEFTSDSKDKQTLRDLLAQKKGAVILTAHVGSWQTALAALDFLDHPRNVVLLRAEGDVDQHFFEHQKEDSPIKVVDPLGPLGGTLEMLEAIRNGEILCSTGDRVLGSDSNIISANFLGSPIDLPMSLYRLASITGAPVVITFSRRVHGKRTHIWIQQVINVPGDLDPTPKNYVPFAQQFADALEQYVGTYPYQYFNFFNIWDNGN